MNIGTFDAKTHFSELIEEVQKGKDYIITKRGKPVARIVPFSENLSIRKDILDQLSKYQDFSNSYFDIIETINLGRK
jgi:prevent-host-death family protein